MQWLGGACGKLGKGVGPRTQAPRINQGRGEARRDWEEEGLQRLVKTRDGLWKSVPFHSHAFPRLQYWV